VFDVCYIVTGRTARRAALSVLFLLRIDFSVFAPHGRHDEPINVKFSIDEETTGPLILLNSILIDPVLSCYLLDSYTTFT